MFSPPEPIYTVSGIRAIEERAKPQADPTLMERAGRVAAEEAVRLTMDRPGTVLIACGPGNNGGDGFVMARRLLQARRPVVVAFAGKTERLPADARAALEAWHEAGGETLSELPDPPAEGWALVVDALFGIGLQRPLEAPYTNWIDTLNALPGPRLAIDIPSGLDANTGRSLGRAFRATHTLSFIALKPGLLTLDGPDHAGAVTVRTLDVDPEALLPAEGQRLRPSMFREHLVPRPFNTHKGSFGDAGIIGGANGMNGAALLAGRAALKLGAGRIFVGMMDRDAPAVDLMQPELMLRAPAVVLDAAGVLALGPGLGLADEARRMMERALPLDIPLILDADALNLIAEDHRLEQICAGRRAATILTPHPAEAGRLLGSDAASVQADRLGAAAGLARRFNALIALKGCGTVVAAPDERWWINCTGHPGMATAGMGDVLTGLVTALIAQHWPLESALIAAVHLHGAAADRLAREGVGPIGLTSGEVIDAARAVFNAWIVQAATPLPESA
ncbi:NAD(P)H-hydrate dehydratase [Pseudazoarcus pumilus]|uniref:Bifunctional NAD(P)H-hydrate repair enzyme n=1 Tax=Pseudazoarcus pumilus TaxID=2067960 RepID=A0A2I6S743_9RHOO|nr:NAD(P)H-hydrate dehydratase [Pseudazoarcus pumilus]AUN95062.1 bifunctional ADP-dependent NAD(P)H-hydrate dehydratase/NAD(P)H-hydrate epimerase [Pseudazoarcus pumilus]